MALRRTDAGLFALTTAGDSVDAHQLLERIDLAAPQTEVTSFAERPIAIARAPEGWAEVRASFDGERRLSLSSTAEGEGPADELPLDHAVDRLVRRGDGWLAFSLQDACRADLSRCLPEQRAALYQLAPVPLRAISHTPLPSPAEPIPPLGFQSNDWLELAAQGDQAALIEHRGFSCRSVADCDALGIEFETETLSGGFMMCDSTDPVCANPEPLPPQTRVRGQRNERWLYPFDAEAAAFSPEVRLNDVDPYGWITGEGFEVASGYALFHFMPTEVYRSTILRAKRELLLLPSLDAAGVEALRRITVRGSPMYVDDNRAVTVEPAGPLGDEEDPLPRALVHRLSLRDSQAYVEQTLELPAGYVGHAWGEEQGYVLLAPQDRCAAQASTLVVLGWSGAAIREKGRLDLPGTSWQLGEVSDRLALLTRQVDGLTQHATIDADEDVALRAIETQPWPLPVSVWDDQVVFGARP
jgi:hypothetical protein